MIFLSRSRGRTGLGTLRVRGVGQCGGPAKGGQVHAAGQEGGELVGRGGGQIAA